MPLGCYETPRIDYTVTQEGTGIEYPYILMPRLISPVKHFDAAPHSMVTLTVRTVSDYGVSDWVLIDIVEWPEIWDQQVILPSTQFWNWDRWYEWDLKAPRVLIPKDP